MTRHIATAINSNRRNMANPAMRRTAPQHLLYLISVSEVTTSYRRTGDAGGVGVRTV